MHIDFDRAKSESNARKRGLPFGLAAEFDWETARYREDVRKTNPERRFVAVGWLHDRLHVLCFTPIPGGVRVISLRRANERERRHHAEDGEEAPDR